MKVAGTDYNLNHKAFEIYLSGCDGACAGCHNPELWDFEVGSDAFGSVFQIIIGKITEPMVQNIWILGGEPLLQNKIALSMFLKQIYYWANGKPLWLWTRFEDKDIPLNLRVWLTYAKTGEYLEGGESYRESMFDIELASTNQKIIEVKKRD